MTDDERRALLWPGLSLPERVALVWLVAQCGLEGRGMAMAELRAVTGLSDRPAREAVSTLLRRGLVVDEGYSLGQPKLRVLSVPWVVGAGSERITIRLPAAGLIGSKGDANGQNTPPRAPAHIYARGSRVISSLVRGDAAAAPGGGASPPKPPSVVPTAVEGMLFPCPANFQPAPAVVAVIAGRWPGLDIDFELAKFTLYFSVEHPRVKRKGWDLSFLGWCERTASRPARASAAPFGAAASPGGRRKSGGEWLDEAIDRMDGTVIEGERE